MNNTDKDWQKYLKKSPQEMRPVTFDEIINDKLPDNVSISEADRKAGSPKSGDMIARNPENHDDQWLVSSEYHAENYEKLSTTPPTESVEGVEELRQKILNSREVQLSSTALDSSDPESLPRLLDALLRQAKQEERERVQQYIDVLKDYIELLRAELDEVVPIAANHGWESDRVEKGREIREKIKQLRGSYER